MDGRSGTKVGGSHVNKFEQIVGKGASSCEWGLGPGPRTRAKVRGGVSK